MEELTGYWQSLSLTDKEDQRIVMQTEDSDGGSIVAAKFLTKRVINVESVLRALKPLWRTGMDFKTRDMGKNKVMLIFQDDADAERVIVNGPWSFDKHLIILSRVDDNTPFSKACFDYMSVWVQIHELPVKMMKEEACTTIGRTLGVVEQVEGIEEGRVRGDFMRIRVNIDIRQLLCRGRKVGTAGGDVHWVSFKYERLTNFCYRCELITHGEQDCEIWLRSRSSLTSDQQQYEAWLRGELEKFRRYHTESTQHTHHTEYKDCGGGRGPRGKPPTGTVKEPTPLDKEISISPRSGSKIPPMPKSDLPSFTQQLKEIDLALESHASYKQESTGGSKLNMEVLHEDPSIYGVPRVKIQNKRMGSTWKRMAGKTKDTRLNVPLFPILGSKRNNGDMHDNETAGELVGKRVRHNIGEGMNEETMITAAAGVQPRRSQ